MIYVNVVDMCSSQRRLQRSRLYGGHIAYVLATGKNKDQLVLPMMRVQNLETVRKIVREELKLHDEHMKLKVDVAKGRNWKEVKDSGQRAESLAYHSGIGD